MADVKTEQEPSIEEILESIRQIISEDTETQPSADKPSTLDLSQQPQQGTTDKAVALDLTQPSSRIAPADKPGPALDLSRQKEAAVGAPSSLDLSQQPQQGTTDKVVALDLTLPSAPVDKQTGPALDLSQQTQQGTADKVVALDLTQPKESFTDTDAPLDLAFQAAPAPAASLPPLDLTDKIVPAASFEPPPSPKTMDMPMTQETNDIMSTQTAAAATEALSKLLTSAMAVEKEGGERSGKLTLEDMARELMKPLIKTWIDQNLPALVEKAVQKEVEKLSRRAMDN